MISDYIPEEHLVLMFILFSPSWNPINVFFRLIDGDPNPPPFTFFDLYLEFLFKLIK